jgi:diacylglycerol O-acyltransferase / wax synthase
LDERRREKREYAHPQDDTMSTFESPSTPTCSKGCVTDVHRLSGSDACMLHLEAPSQSLNGCGVWELDTSTIPGGYSFDSFRAKLSARLAVLPEFRMKLADSALHLDTQVWVEDLAFDLDRHLHRVELPPPGTRRELSELVGRVMAEPTNLSRPMWDMWVVEGLARDDPDFNGPVAVVLRFHHVLGDGVAAADMLARLSGTEIDPPTPPFVDGAGNYSTRDIALAGLRRFAYRPWFALTRVVPAIVMAMLRTILRIAQGQATSWAFTAPATPFNGTITQPRSAAFVRLDLENVKKVRHKFGVTVNDVMLAVVSGALRQYLLGRAALPKSPLIAMIPVSAFNPDRPSRNQVSLMFSRMHTDVVDPAARLRATAAASSVAKKFSSAIGPTLMQDVLDCAPGLFGTVVGLYSWSKLSGRRPMCNVIVSNIRRPDVQYYLFGAAVQDRYVFAPVFHGAGLSIEVMTLNRKLTVGLNSCSDLLPDLWDLADRLPVALAELVEATA